MIAGTHIGSDSRGQLFGIPSISRKDIRSRGFKWTSEEAFVDGGKGANKDSQENKTFSNTGDESFGATQLPSG